MNMHSATNIALLRSTIAFGNGFRPVIRFLLSSLLIFSSLQAQQANADNTEAAQAFLKEQMRNASTLPLSELLRFGAWEAFEQRVSINSLPQERSSKERIQLAEYWMLNNDFKKAESFVKALDPVKPKTKLLRARLHIEAWELDSADLLLRKLENLLPEARFWLGRLQLLQKQYVFYFAL